MILERQMIQPVSYDSMNLTTAICINIANNTGLVTLKTTDQLIPSMSNHIVLPRKENPYVVSEEVSKFRQTSPSLKVFRALLTIAYLPTVCHVLSDMKQLFGDQPAQELWDKV